MDRDPNRSQKPFKIDKRHVNPSSGRSTPFDASNNAGFKFPPIHRGALVETVPRPGDSERYTPVDLRKAIMSPVYNGITKETRSKTCISPEPGAPLNPKPDGNFGLGLELAGKSLTLKPGGDGRICDVPSNGGFDDRCDVCNAAADDVTNVGSSYPHGYLDDFEPCESTGSSQAEYLSGTAGDEFGRRPNPTVVVDPGPANLDGDDEGWKYSSFTSGIVSCMNPVGSLAGIAEDVGLPDPYVVVDPGPSNLIGSDECVEGIPNTHLSRGVSSDFNYADPIGGTGEHTQGVQLQGENICMSEELRMQADTSVQRMVDLDEEIKHESLRTLDPHPPGERFLPRPPSARKARPRKHPPVRCVKPTLPKVAENDSPPALKIDKRASPDGGNAELEPSSGLCGPTSETPQAVLDDECDSSDDMVFDYGAIWPAVKALSPQHSYLRLDRASFPSPESIISSGGATPPPIKLHVTESGSRQAVSETQGDRSMGSAGNYRSAHTISTTSFQPEAPPKLSTHSAESGINLSPLSKQEKAERKRKRKEMKEKEAQRKEEEANAKEIARMKAEQEVANISTNRALFGRKDALPAIGKRTSETSFCVGKLLKVKEVDLTTAPTVDASAAVDIIDRNDARVRTTSFLKQISQDYINASHRILAKPEVTNQAPEIIKMYEDDIGRPYERYGGVQYSLRYETGNGNGHENGSGNINRSGSARRRASAV